MARHVPVSLVVLVLLAPAALALDPLGGQDDAASGADAPDAADDALVLAPGTYTGTLDDPIDAQDWYTLAVAADQVLRIDLHPISGAVWLRIETLEGDEVHANLASGRDIRYVGVDGQSYRFQLGTDFPSGASATYAFTVTLLTTIPQTDGGLPGDASGVRANARHLEPGSYAGELYPPSFDLNDRYHIAKPWGALVNVTFTPEPGKTITLILESISRQDIVRTSSGAPITISTDNDVENIRLSVPEGGVHSRYTFAFHWWVPDLPRIEDDAGLGIDAPDGFEDLPVLPEGSHVGRAQFAWGDDVDRFAFTVPADRYLDVTLTHVEGRAIFGVFKADGAVVQELHLFNPGSLRVRAEPGDYVFSIHRWYEDDFFVKPLQALYRIDAYAPVRPDVSVTNVEVQLSDAPIPLYKVVSATISNAGTRDVVTSVTFYAIDSTGVRSTIGTHTLNVGPGASRVITDGWGHIGSVGEFTLGASASTPFDPNSANDVAETRASGVADPGLGVGVGQHLALIMGGPFGP